jgi:hypothetical protein
VIGAWARGVWATLTLAIAALAIAACSRAFDGSSIPYGYLTPKDVEQATGISGLRLDKDTSGAYVFVEASTGRRVVQVRSGNDNDYARWKEQPSAFRAPVPGLGREAYQGPVEGHDPTVIAVVKGDHALEISAIPDMLGTSVSFDQLYRIASTAAGRM